MKEDTNKTENCNYIDISNGLDSVVLDGTFDLENLIEIIEKAQQSRIYEEVKKKKVQEFTRDMICMSRSDWNKHIDDILLLLSQENKDDKSIIN